jgi:hypothetical protein
MMGWVGNVTCMAAKKNVYKAFVGYLKERDHLEDLVVGGSIMLSVP